MHRDLTVKFGEFEVFQSLALWVCLLTTAHALAVSFDKSSPKAFVQDCVGKFYRVKNRLQNRAQIILMGEEMAHQKRLTDLRHSLRRELPPSQDGYPRVYVSLTTIPSRLATIETVIKSLDLTHIEKVFLAVPKVFGRNDELYPEIPMWLHHHPKIEVLGLSPDLGPISKLIPAAEYLQKIDPYSALITIDDDQAYPIGMVNELIYASRFMPDAIIGGSGLPLSFWGIEGKATTRSNFKDIFLDQKVRFRSADVVEGFSGIIYPVSKLNTSKMRLWNDFSSYARVSDDLVISLVSMEECIELYQLKSSYFSRDDIYPLPIGFQADALYRGAGLANNMVSSPNVNNQKYQQTYQKLRPFLVADCW